MMVAGKGTFSHRLIFLRLALAGIIIPLILTSKSMLAVFFFIVAALLAFIEGMIQKRLPEISQRRRFLDFTADKVLVNAAALTLATANIIPFWIPAVFFARDAITIIGALFILFRNHDAELKSTLTGKMALFFQVVALIPAILGHPDQTLLIIAMAATVVSAIEAFFKSDLRKTRIRPRLSQFSMVSMVKVPDILSLGNVVCGLLSIMFAISGLYSYAALILVGAVIFDFFDGKVARWLSQQHEFGKELDSLADTISFGVAPAIFAFSLIQTKLAIISFTIFVFCGILRLARYNIISGQMPAGYIGMPITFNGILIPLVYFAGVDPRWFPYMYLVLGFLMVSSIKVKKF